MPSYQKLINNIIPADDLHWCEEEGKYVSLSQEETNKIIMRCIEQGMGSFNDIYKVVSWCGLVRVGDILWRNFLSGNLEITGFDNKKEPIFTTPRRQNER